MLVPGVKGSKWRAVCAGVDSNNGHSFFCDASPTHLSLHSDEANTHDFDQRRLYSQPIFIRCAFVVEQ